MLITKSLLTKKVIDYQAFRMTHILHFGATSFETEQMSEMQRPRASEIRQNPVLAFIYFFKHERNAPYMECCDTFFKDLN